MPTQKPAARAMAAAQTHVLHGILLGLIGTRLRGWGRVTGDREGGQFTGRDESRVQTVRVRIGCSSSSLHVIERNGTQLRPLNGLL